MFRHEHCKKHKERCHLYNHHKCGSYKCRMIKECFLGTSNVTNGDADAISDMTF